MSFSVESLLFRAVAAAVNTAAKGANTLLLTMYPPDISHIWDDPALGGGAADPHPAAHGAGEAASTPSASPAPLTWEGWAVPAVLEVLADYGVDTEVDNEDIARDIAARIGCDPSRAALALTSLQTQ
jgi:hypothetical protein